MREIPKERVLSKLTPAQRSYVAQQMADEIRRQSKLERRNALDIHKALVHFNVALARAMAEDVGEAQYLPEEEAEDFVSTILVGIQCDDPRYVRALTHELAHHLQRVWVAPNLFDASVVICKNQDNESVRHEIARETERCVFDEDGEMIRILR